MRKNSETGYLPVCCRRRRRAIAGKESSGKLESSDTDSKKGKTSSLDRNYEQQFGIEHVLYEKDSIKGSPKKLRIRRYNDKYLLSKFYAYVGDIYFECKHFFSFFNFCKCLDWNVKVSLEIIENDNDHLVIIREDFDYCLIEMDSCLHL
uniref:Uncharacterized protein n=1 Tax=Lactuca sativa TaxID=4236 RepID=A0A9R1W5D6_LACSA|nr:hypothetical protein LSAT_V11C300149700 [Lactuca sativa]